MESTGKNNSSRKSFLGGGKYKISQYIAQINKIIKNLTQKRLAQLTLLIKFKKNEKMEIL